MKRNVINVVLGVFVAMVFGLTGCGGGGSTTATPTSDTNVTGTWKGTTTITYANTASSSDTMTLVLTQSSKTVSGTITSQSDGKTANITGSVDGNNLTFTMAAGGTGTTMTLVSQVNGNTMTAKSASGFGSPNGTQVQISSWSGTLTKQTTTPTTPSTPHFVDKGNGTIYDTVNNLTWLKNANCFSYKTWDNAISLSNNLASGQCGLSDGSIAGNWHLPTVDELMIFLNSGYNISSLTSAGFANVQNAYWSSTIKDASKAYGVSFDNGYRIDESKTFTTAVWPVRSGQ
jgi:hypothetical protein